jgi:hypothetical protein
MSCEEFPERVPETFRAEWVDGAVIPLRPPKVKHQTPSASGFPVTEDSLAAL